MQATYHSVQLLRETFVRPFRLMLVDQQDPKSLKHFLKRDLIAYNYGNCKIYVLPTFTLSSHGREVFLNG